MANMNELANSLLMDDSFVEWVLNPSTERNLKWNAYAAASATQAEAVMQAKNMVTLLYKTVDYTIADNKTSEEIWKRVEASLHQSEPKHNISALPVYRRWWWAAAAIFVLFSVGIIYKFLLPGNGLQNKIAAIALDSIHNISRENLTSANEIILLSDGSKVFLKPGSKLLNKKIFSGPVREVYLSGEAFFEIKKDPQHPFLVHANNVVTRVLGTSFLVRAVQGKEDVTVAVRTGKVSVSNERFTKDDKENELILLPNQQAVINVSAKTSTKSNVQDTTIIQEPPHASYNMDFDQSPVVEVLNAIEKTYAVKINYDKEKLANCNITTSLSDEPLQTKILIICKAINATYQITDNSVNIHSDGCK